MFKLQNVNSCTYLLTFDILNINSERDELTDELSNINLDVSKLTSSKSNINLENSRLTDELLNVNSETEENNANQESTEMQGINLCSLTEKPVAMWCFGFFGSLFQKKD